MARFDVDTHAQARVRLHTHTHTHTHRSTHTSAHTHNTLTTAVHRGRLRQLPLPAHGGRPRRGGQPHQPQLHRVSALLCHFGCALLCCLALLRSASAPTRAWKRPAAAPACGPGGGTGREVAGSSSSSSAETGRPRRPSVRACTACICRAPPGLAARNSASACLTDLAPAAPSAARPCRLQHDCSNQPQGQLGDQVGAVRCAAGRARRGDCSAGCLAGLRGPVQGLFACRRCASTPPACASRRLPPPALTRDGCAPACAAPRRQGRAGLLRARHQRGPARAPQGERGRSYLCCVCCCVCRNAPCCGCSAAPGVPRPARRARRWWQQGRCCSSDPHAAPPLTSFRRASPLHSRCPLAAMQPLHLALNCHPLQTAPSLAPTGHHGEPQHAHAVAALTQRAPCPAPSARAKLEAPRRGSAWRGAGGRGASHLGRAAPARPLPLSNGSQRGFQHKAGLMGMRQLCHVHRVMWGMTRLPQCPVTPCMCARGRLPAAALRPSQWAAVTYILPS